MIKVWLISWWLVTWSAIEVLVYDKFGHFIKNKSELKENKESNHCALYTNKDSLDIFINEFKHCYDCAHIEIDTFSLTKEEIEINRIFCKRNNNQ